MTSAHLHLDRSDPAALADQAAEFAAAGLDLGIVYLPPPHTAADLETVAKVVTEI